MSKDTFSIFFFFAALLGGALYYGSLFQKPLHWVSENIKNTYNSAIESVSDTFEEHFNQQKTIIRLKSELQKYDKNHLLMHQFATELNDLFQENNSSFKVNPDIELVRAISYAKFADINRLWLKMDDFNSSKVYGLVHKERTAGIVISKNGKPLALLNNDFKSSYAVYVGSNKAPGIIRGQNEKNLIVEFIPTWIDIAVGDEVITSGMDNLFFKGIKVGKVLSLQQSQGYQSAVVKPYYEAKEPGYFHVIRKIR